MNDAAPIANGATVTAMPTPIWAAAPIPSLHHNSGHHSRVNGAVVAIRARLIELVRKGLVRVQSARAELSRVADDRVRLIVVVGPSYRGTGFDGKRHGLIHEGLAEDLGSVARLGP